jgi:hypothetical protein
MENQKKEGVVVFFLEFTAADEKKRLRVTK